MVVVGGFVEPCGLGGVRWMSLRVLTVQEYPKLLVIAGIPEMFKARVFVVFRKSCPCLLATIMTVRDSWHSSWEV